MKFAAFIHNDDKKCFHVALQGIHKLIMMGHINFKDHMLIKRQWAGKKMNATGRKFKDKKHEVTIESNLHLLLEIMCDFEILEFTAA
jgi:hypothetical protein